MTVGELVRYCKEKHLPFDSTFLTFQEDKLDSKTERSIDHVMNVAHAGNIHYVKLVGYL
jgi:hypothetical protein